MKNTPDSKVHGANMGPIWGWQDPGGPHVGPMNFAIWDSIAPCQGKGWGSFTSSKSDLYPVYAFVT